MHRHPQLLFAEVEEMAGEALGPVQLDHVGGKMVNAVLDALFAIKCEPVDEFTKVH